MAPAFDTNGVWFITGCSAGGLGSSIAKYVHEQGHNVVATARNVASLHYLPDGPKVLKLSLDVTSQDSITAAVNSAVKRFGRLDVVINNAGYGAMSELEGFPEDETRKQMETNFWGPMHLTRESIRVFREVNAPGQGGTIIQVSSMGGYLGYPGNSMYHAR
jgi:NAD(P)-dependent dehydrogenase (short-subunit alcohol dehydrogenase family)